jgi:hypothetical protein
MLLSSVTVMAPSDDTDAAKNRPPSEPAFEAAFKPAFKSLRIAFAADDGDASSDENSMLSAAELEPEEPPDISIDVWWRPPLPASPLADPAPVPEADTDMVPEAEEDAPTAMFRD